MGRMVIILPVLIESALRTRLFRALSRRASICAPIGVEIRQLVLDAKLIVLLSNPVWREGEE